MGRSPRETVIQRAPWDERLDRELFPSPSEARFVHDPWRMDRDHGRPHGGLQWLIPAPTRESREAAGSRPSGQRSESFDLER